jgi:hypothetical protein
VVRLDTEHQGLGAVDPVRDGTGGGGESRRSRSCCKCGDSEDEKAREVVVFSRRDASGTGMLGDAAGPSRWGMVVIRPARRLLNFDQDCEADVVG